MYVHRLFQKACGGFLEVNWSLNGSIVYRGKLPPPLHETLHRDTLFYSISGLPLHGDLV